MKLAHPYFPAHRPLVLEEILFPEPLSVVVLGPHPDDFDAIGVSMRFLHRQGHVIHVAVLTGGANGIEDGWNGLNSSEEKAAQREAEQRASCRYFGLPEERLRFMHMWEATDAEPADQLRLRDFLLACKPDLVFLPHGNDSNKTHRRTYESFRAIAIEEKLKLCACLNLDAKTLSFRPDLYTFFGSAEATWKGELLRFHRSQQERNLRSRQQGFDERVLQVNREAALNAGSGHAYAEVFELEFFD